MILRSTIRYRIIHGLQITIVVCLFLTGTLYYLVESGSANSFPTYLTALAMLPLLFLKPQIFGTLDRVLLPSVGLLVFYLAMSVGWSDSGESVTKHLGYALLVIAFCISIALLITEFPHVLRWLLIAVVSAALVNAIYSLYLHYAIPDHNPLPEPRLFALGRLNNPVVSGLSYGFATVLCAYLFMTAATHLQRILVAVSISVFLIVITLTWTRGVWLALAMALTLGAITQYSRDRRVLLIAIFTIASIIGGALFVGLGTDILFKRAWSFRPEIWMEFTSRAFEANPIFGAGLTSDSLFHLGGEPEPFKHPHSLFVATFYYSGFTGLLMYLAVLAISIKKLTRPYLGTIRTLAVMCLAYGLTASLVDGNELLVKVNYVWLLIWFPVGLLMIRAKVGDQDL